MFCGYPLSERHHALPYATFGESACILQLCSNCHELYHIVQDVALSKRPRAVKILKVFTQRFGEDDIRLQKAYHFIAAAINIANGVEP